MIHDRYIGRSVITASLLALVILIAVFSFFSLVDQLDDTGHANYGVFQAIREFCKNFPFEIIYAMPLGSHQCVIRKTKF